RRASCSVNSTSFRWIGSHHPRLDTAAVRYVGSQSRAATSSSASVCGAGGPRRQCSASWECTSARTHRRPGGGGPPPPPPPPPPLDRPLLQHPVAQRLPDPRVSRPP